MPYPDQKAYDQTRPETALDGPTNAIAGGVGNAHTRRGTAGDPTSTGQPMPPYDGPPIYVLQTRPGYGLLTRANTALRTR